MTDPPDAQKQHEQESLQTGVVGYDRTLDVPAPTFKILKRGLDAHTPPVRLHAGAPSRLVGEQEPGRLIPRLPDSAEKGVQVVLLPDEGWAEPGLAHTVHQVAQRPPAASALATKRSAGVLARQAQQVMPASGSAQQDQWQAREATVGKERTVGLAQGG